LNQPTQPTVPSRRLAEAQAALEIAAYNLSSADTAVSKLRSALEQAEGVAADRRKKFEKCSRRVEKVKTKDEKKALRRLERIKEKAKAKQVCCFPFHFRKNHADLFLP
jgi:chromosome segregation ATPase